MALISSSLYFSENAFKTLSSWVFSRSSWAIISPIWFLIFTINWFTWWCKFINCYAIKQIFYLLLSSFLHKNKATQSQDYVACRFMSPLGQHLVTIRPHGQPRNDLLITAKTHSTNKCEWALSEPPVGVKPHGRPRNDLLITAKAHSANKCEWALSEPPVGIKPTTYWLQVSCSISWAMGAYLTFPVTLPGDSSHRWAMGAFCFPVALSGESSHRWAMGTCLLIVVQK